VKTDPRYTIAKTLRDIAKLLEVRGETSFKVRAYETGASALEELERPLAPLVEAGELEKIPGIGKSLAKHIEEIHRTGQSHLLAELRAALPPGVLELARIPNLGPKKVAALVKELGVGTVAELFAAASTGRVAQLKGFGAKTERKILDSIALYERQQERILLVDAMTIADALCQHLAGCPAAHKVAPAGSLRRFRETVADVDVVVATGDPGAVMDHFQGWERVAQVEGRGDTKCTVRLDSGLQVDLRAVPEVDFATALHHFTGSKAHNVKLRGWAREQGFTLSEWGLVRLKPAPGQPDKVPIASEAELYERLGLRFIPPELREDEGELEAARDGTLPDDLICREDIRGLVHCHTAYSDGKNTIEEMARAAETMGIEYITITDHSPTASYAGGVTLDRLARQWDEIARVQERVKVRILRGTESDILADGSLDYPDEVLERLDVVIASIHTRGKMDREQMTTRLCAAMQKPVFKIWGHALGRLLLKRPPFKCDVERVLDAAADARAAVEINGDPNRLDLEPRWIRAARERGIPLVISVDAHSTAALDYIRFGVGTARRGWVRRGEVLNTLDVAGFARAVRPTQ
jgi:DNA polymerase (family 10)